MKKRIVLLLSLFSLTFLLAACSKTPAKADYSESKFETALNDGKNLKGKTVKLKVAKLEPQSAFGYNILAGDHLNFVNEENPDVKKGDTVIVKVKKVASTLGSWIITYTDLQKVK